MEVAYVEHVLKAKIHHKLDIDQFRRKEYEKPKVRLFHVARVRACVGACMRVRANM